MGAITSPRAENISIGELSKQSGVNIETIRYYERIKMMPAPPRTASGRRLYGPAERRTLAFIRRSRDLGFALEEIRALKRKYANQLDWVHALVVWRFSVVLASFSRMASVAPTHV